MTCFYFKLYAGNGAAGQQKTGEIFACAPLFGAPDGRPGEGTPGHGHPERHPETEAGAWRIAGWTCSKAAPHSFYEKKKDCDDLIMQSLGASDGVDNFNAQKESSEVFLKVDCAYCPEQLTRLDNVVLRTAKCWHSCSLEDRDQR